MNEGSSSHEPNPDGEPLLWPEIVEHAETAHPWRPLALAILAETDPKNLDKALNRITFEDGDEDEADDDEEYDDESPDEDPIVIHKFEQDELGIKHRTNVISNCGEMEGQSGQLVVEVHRLRLSLSKTPRIIVAALAAAAMGVPIGIGIREFGESHILHEPHQTKVEASHNQQFLDDSGAVLGGTLLGLLGALGLQFRLTDKNEKFGIATRLAHRKAQKALAKFES